MDSEISRATRRNAVSVALTKSVSTVVNLGGSALLARLLAPADFGVLGLAIFYYAFVNQLLDFGLDPALLACQKDLPLAGGTHFRIKATLGMLGVFLSAVALSMNWAPLEVRLMVMVLAVSYLLDNLGATPRILMERELAIWKLNLVELVATTTSWVVSAFCAYIGWGVWSLGVQKIVLSAIQTVGFLFLGRTRFTLEYTSSLAKYFFSKFGVPIWIGSWFAWLLQADRLIISRFLDLNVLGYYVKAYEFATIPLITMGVFLRPTSPLYSRFQDKTPDLARLFNSVQLIKLRMIVPLLISIWLVAERAVVWMYGDQWLPCVPFAKILVIYTFLRFFFDDSPYPLTLGFNAPKQFTLVQIMQGLVAVGLWLVMVPAWGAIGAAWGRVLMLLIAMMMAWYLISRRIRVEWARLLIPELCYLLFAAAVWSVVRFLSRQAGVDLSELDFIMLPSLVLAISLSFELRRYPFRRLISARDWLPFRL